MPRPSGRHFVRAERAGFLAVGRVVESGAGSTEVRLTLAAAPAPSPAALARRGGLADATRTVGGYIAGGAHAAVTLVLVERTGHVLGKSALPVDDQLTSGALAATVDGLLGESDHGRSRPCRCPGIAGRWCGASPVAWP